METNSRKLQKKIMRRVYAVFAWRLAMHPVTMQVGLFGVALLILAKLVHVSRVADSMLSTSLSNLPNYLFNTVVHAFMRGEVLTLIAVGVIVFTALSIPWGLYQITLPKRFFKFAPRA